MSSKKFVVIATLVLLTLSSVRSQCQISADITGTVNCTDQDLTSIPQGNWTDETVNIYLQLNDISEINTTGLQYLQNLQQLWLQSNLITVVESGAFDGLTVLRILRLENNLITVIEHGAFDGLDNLYYLTLYGNIIRSMSTTAITGLTALNTLYYTHGSEISQNPLRCTEAEGPGAAFYRPFSCSTCVNNQIAVVDESDYYVCVPQPSASPSQSPATSSPSNIPTEFTTSLPSIPVPTASPMEISIPVDDPSNEKSVLDDGAVVGLIVALIVVVILVVVIYIIKNKRATAPSHNESHDQLSFVAGKTTPSSTERPRKKKKNKGSIITNSLSTPLHPSYVQA